SAVMILAALGWLFRPILEQRLPGVALSDASIAIAGALALFVLPVDLKRGRFALSWQDAKTIRWDVLILFGGGLALATAIGETDLATWLSEGLTGLGALPLVLLMLVVGLVTVFGGELASNTATAAILLPVAGAAAAAMGEPAVSLALPVALFATLGFMLPVATPPNAIVFGSGVLTVGQMLRAGAALDVIGVLVVILAVLTIGARLF
ncbi:MAG: SLC13 family permease, partial [Alphaproteobacteria bacterium]